MKDGLVETPQRTTPTPGMYEEVEQGDDVARGCVLVKEIIVYEATKEPRRYSPDKAGGIGEIRTDREGKTLYVEVPRGPYFCQPGEYEQIFAENNLTGRKETYTIQLLKATAIKYINDPENMKQFARS